MTYPFVPAPDHWARATPIKAIVIHMAEGGGTVSWLQHPDGNSSHYVVEYSGRIVQMVREDQAAGSINPKLLRVTDDAPYAYNGETIVYGHAEARAALGVYWPNPNSAVIAIEVEGFARDGPKDVQRAALEELVADIRSRHPDLAALGHRDFQSYKACPGKLIPWADYGGHGPAKEEDVAGLAIEITAPAYGLVTVKDIQGVQAVQIADRERFNQAPGAVKNAYAKGISRTADFFPGEEVYIIGDEAAVFLARQVDYKAVPVPGGGDIIRTVVIEALVGDEVKGSMEVKV